MTTVVSALLLVVVVVIVLVCLLAAVVANNFVVVAVVSGLIYLCAMGIMVSPAVMAGSGASTVKTPSLLSDERMDSGLTPFGKRNSRLYSL